jgi:hypothetical protein
MSRFPELSSRRVEPETTPVVAMAAARLSSRHLREEEEMSMSRRHTSVRPKWVLLGVILIAGSLGSAPAIAGTNAWTAIGPSGANVHAVAVSPAASTGLVAGTTTGYATSTNGGASWNVVTTGHETDAVAFDPGNASIVYAGTPVALARSTDGGATYSVAIPEYTLCVTFDPTDPRVLFVGTTNYIYKSTDRGLTWLPAFSRGVHSFFRAIVIDPSHTNVVYATSQFSGLVKSTDGGTTWASLVVPAGGGTFNTIAVHPTNSMVYAIGSSAIVGVTIVGGGVYRSTDGGSSWTSSQRDLESTSVLLTDPQAPDTLYAAGLAGFSSSADAGATWNTLNSGLTSTNVQALAFDPADHRKLYAGTAGGGVFAMTMGSTGPPVIRVTSPNGGERWEQGTTHPITWTASSSITNVKIEYSGSAPFATIAASVPNSGNYSWTLPAQTMTTNAFVRVSDAAGTTSDTSDAPFEITWCSGHVNFTPPFGDSFTGTGGRGTVNVVTGSGCPWAATSQVSWIAVESGWTGSGSGTVTYAVAPDLGSSARTGSLEIGGKTFPVSQSAAAAGTEAVLFVPIVLDVHGVGDSHYTSELTLTNRSSHDASVRLTYTGAADLGGGSGTATIVLPAGKQRIEGDAIATLKALGVSIPDSGSRGGTLTVGFSGVSSVSEAAATVRTTTPVVNGQAGLAYPGIQGWRGLTGPSYLCGLRENGTDRSNVALQNAGSPSDGAITLRVTVQSGDSAASVVLPDVTLAPGGFKQINSILGTNGMANGYVKVERIAGTAPYFAYGVINDAVNSDGSFVPPQPETTAAVTGLTLPVVIEAGVYTSELVVTNWSSRQRTLTLSFVSDQIDRSDHTAFTTLVLGPKGQAILPNVFQYFRDRSAPGVGPAGSGYVGALFVTAADGDVQGLFVGARTSSPGGGGRYGLFYPATPFGQGKSDVAWICGLQQNDTSRTNLAIVNTGEAGSGDDVFAIDVYEGATGRLVHTESGITVGAKRWWQQNTVLASYAPGVTDGYAAVRRVGGSNPFLAYGVINDGGVPQKRSDDGAYLAASE